MRFSSLLAMIVLASVSVATAAETRPPEYPDSEHVPQGCFISSFTYLHRYQADFPAEIGRTLTVGTRSYPGAHTLAVMTYRGQWWARDEYYGVFPLGCAATGSTSSSTLTKRAEAALLQVATHGDRAGMATGADEAPRALSAEESRREVLAASRLLPVAHTVVWVSSNRGNLAYLFFQPAAGEIAVYEPCRGTASATCNSSDAAAVVRAVASRQGVQVNAVTVAPDVSANRLALR